MRSVRIAFNGRFQIFTNDVGFIFYHCYSIRISNDYSYQKMYNIIQYLIVFWKNYFSRIMSFCARIWRGVHFFRFWSWTKTTTIWLTRLVISYLIEVLYSVQTIRHHKKEILNYK